MVAVQAIKECRDQHFKLLLVFFGREHLRRHFLIEQYAATEGITEQLKAEDQLAWVGRMNSIRERVEEIVLSELVYC
jgi:hypothetical protein